MKPLVQSLWVGLGGFLGANARYWVGGWIATRWGSAFPWGTLVVNLSGAFLLGLLATLTTEKLPLPQEVRLLVSVGFIGAYTTFSTWEYESLRLLEVGSFSRAAANLFGSLVLGLLAVWVGLKLARLG